jgi:hypothetical protein
VQRSEGLKAERPKKDLSTDVDETLTFAFLRHYSDRRLPVNQGQYRRIGFARLAASLNFVARLPSPTRCAASFHNDSGDLPCL